METASSFCPFFTKKLKAAPPNEDAAMSVPFVSAVQRHVYAMSHFYGNTSVSV